MKSCEAPRRRILAVDDTPEVLLLLSRLLDEGGYEVSSITDPKHGLEEARRQPPDLVLLDINMPGMNGYEFCTALKADALLSEIPVIFLSSFSETFDKIKAFEAGGVDYVTKPFQSQELLSRVATHIKLRDLRAELERYSHRLEELVLDKVREISASHVATLFALANLSEARDKDTGCHLERVRTFCRLLAETLSETNPHEGLMDASFIHNIEHASPLHDIGKVAIPDAILLKPGPLSPPEFAVMKTHTVIGSDTLAAVEKRYPGNSFVNMGIDIARSHHEWWNGRGYPDGLAGRDIPLSAHIVAVADVYDALRSQRCYKSPYTHETTIEIIKSESGAHFDDGIVNAFLSVQNDFRVIYQRMRQ